MVFRALVLLLFARLLPGPRLSPSIWSLFSTCLRSLFQGMHDPWYDSIPTTQLPLHLPLIILTLREKSKYYTKMDLQHDLQTSYLYSTLRSTYCQNSKLVLQTGKMLRDHMQYVPNWKIRQWSRQQQWMVSLLCQNNRQKHRNGIARRRTTYTVSRPWWRGPIKWARDCICSLDRVEGQVLNDRPFHSQQYDGQASEISTRRRERCQLYLSKTEGILP